MFLYFVVIFNSIFDCFKFLFKNTVVFFACFFSSKVKIYNYYLWNSYFLTLISIPTEQRQMNQLIGFWKSFFFIFLLGNILMGVFEIFTYVNLPVYREFNKFIQHGKTFFDLISLFKILYCFILCYLFFLFNVSIHWHYPT